jgi:transposase-like protein
MPLFHDTKCPSCGSYNYRRVRSGISRPINSSFNTEYIYYECNECIESTGWQTKFTVLRDCRKQILAPWGKWYTKHGWQC